MTVVETLSLDLCNYVDVNSCEHITSQQSTTAQLLRDREKH